MKKTLNLTLLKPFIDFADVLWGRRVGLAYHAAMPLRDTYSSTGTLGLYLQRSSPSKHFILDQEFLFQLSLYFPIDSKLEFRRIERLFKNINFWVGDKGFEFDAPEPKCHP